MKRMQRIAPALVVLVVLMVGALAIGLVSRGLNTQESEALNNTKLVKKAVANMVLLSSFHVEFNGPWQGTHTNIKADVQLPGPGAWSGVEGKPVPGSRFTFTTGEDANQGEVPADSEQEIIWATDNKYYETNNGGKNWREMLFSDPSQGTIGFLTLLSPWYDAASPLLVFNDAGPSPEKIEGVAARHLVADVSHLNGYYSWELRGAGGLYGGTPTTIEIWISTERTPAVLKMIVGGTQATTPAEQGTNGSGGQEAETGEPYTLTWSWSRFNEDLGRIKPPPTETVR